MHTRHLQILVLELELEHCMFTENLLRRLFISTLTLIHLQDKMTYDICGMREILAKTSSFNMFFV